jgi:NAD(P)-dependent dehydrogenase (short-subunit alcohol dehydrogenase family)
MSKTVLVTGASKGIGRAIALGMADRGYDVVINDIVSEQAGLDTLAAEIQGKGQRALPIVADVSNKQQVNAMIKKTVDEWGVLDVLVNNAGVLTVSSVEDLAEDAWDRVFEVNAKGVFLVTQAVLSYMKERREGRIIHIASIGGKRGGPGQAHYCSSKGAVIEFTRVLAMELGPYGITVNAVCPGIILTEMGRNNLGSQAEIDKWTDATCLKRLGEPEDVVGSVAFFAGEDSAYITGQSLNVCGGIIFY